jgi:hypothetical protein
MLRFADRVKETANVSGAGAYALTGAVAGHRGFVAGLGDGAKCAYCAELGSAWEVGMGTVSGGSLSRDRILTSSNGGAAVAWPSSTAVNIFCVAPADVLQSNTSRGVVINTTGALQAMTGVARWYPPIPMRLTSWEAWVGEAPVGANVQFTLRKNGISAATGSIVSGSVRMALVDLSLELTTTDYLTLDITGVGVAPKGSDLAVRLVP